MNHPFWGTSIYGNPHIHRLMIVHWHPTTLGFPTLSKLPRATLALPPMRPICRTVTKFATWKGSIFGSSKAVWPYNYPIGSMYGIYANIWGILMVNVTIYTIHGSYDPIAMETMAYVFHQIPWWKPIEHGELYHLVFWVSFTHSHSSLKM